MTRLNQWILAAVLLLLAGMSMAQAQPVLGVADFRNDSGAGWWRGGVGRDLAGMLSNELAATGAFRVVERGKLEAVLGEQDMAAAGRMAPGQGAQIGRLVGADYLVMGTITAYEENTASRGGGVSFRGVSLGGKGNEAYLAIDLRVVDVNTGELAYVRSIEGRSGGRGVRVGLNRGGFGGSLASEDKTPAGQAIRAGLMEITDYLECVMVARDGCEGEYAAKEQRRRERTRGALRTD